MRKNFENFDNIQVLNWLEKSEQNHIFSETDIAITRGSATTLAELDFFHIQKIINFLTPRNMSLTVIFY